MVWASKSWAVVGMEVSCLWRAPWYAAAARRWTGYFESLDRSMFAGLLPSPGAGAEVEAGAADG